MMIRKTKQLISQKKRMKERMREIKEMMLKTMKRVKMTRMIRITGEEMEIRMVIKKMKPMMQEKMRKTKIMMKKAKGKKNTDL